MKLILAIVLLFSFDVTYSQSIILKGQVNMPCEIIVEEINDSTFTDINGNFQINNLKKGNSVRFEAPGFYPKWIKVDSTVLNLNIGLEYSHAYFFFDGCPTTQVMISKYWLSDMAEKDSIKTIAMYDWDNFLKKQFGDYVIMHKTDLDSVKNREQSLNAKFIEDSLQNIREFEICNRSESKSKYECDYFSKLGLDTLKYLLSVEKQSICFYNRYFDYKENGHLLAADNSKYQTKIKYDELERTLPHNKLVGFKTACSSDCCENIVFVNTNENVVKPLNYKLFKEKLLPIDNISKALFCINYSKSFVNAYGYGLIPFYKVKYLQSGECFYIEHVLYMQDKNYYHVLIKISKNGKIEILKKDKNFKFGPCY